MKLSVKTLLAVLAVTAISFSAALLIRILFELPQLKSLEAEADRKDIERVITGFVSAQFNLSTLAYEFGVSNAAYKFVESPNDEFIKENLHIDTFVGGGINLLVFSDINGNPIFSRYADLENEVFPESSFAGLENIKRYLPNAREAFTRAPISNSGIIDTPKGPMIYGAISVLKTDEEMPSAGTLMLGRLIDQPLVTDINAVTRVNFKSYQLSEDQIATFKAMDFTQQSRSPSNTINWYLYVSGDPILGLELQLEDRTFDDGIFSIPLIVAASVMIVCWSLLMIVLNYSLVKPILRIGEHLINIRFREDYSLRLNDPRKDELGTLAQECDRLIEYVERQQYLVQRQAAELEKLSYEDSLTGLANRRRFDEQLEVYLELAKRGESSLALILIDVDHFKLYNDNYGHQKGDTALMAIGQAMKNCISRKTDIAARYGGEEFALLLPNMDLEGAQHVANGLMQLIEKANIPHEFSPVSERLTVSAGIAMAGPDVRTEAQLIQRADNALYRAKELGRNRITI